METPLRLQPHSAGAPPHYWCHGELVGLRRGDMPLATEELAVIGFSNSFSRTVRTQILQFRIRPWCGQLPCGWALKILAISLPLLLGLRLHLLKQNCPLHLKVSTNGDTPVQYLSAVMVTFKEGKCASEHFFHTFKESYMPTLSKSTEKTLHCLYFFHIWPLIYIKPVNS